MKTTVSLRAMMAGIPAAAMMPAAAKANGAPVPHFATTDPAIAAIERHRQAMLARLGEHDDGTRMQLLAAERDAWLAWLTTPPTTLAGLAATLEHASRRPYPHNPDYPDDYVRANLAEAAEYLDDTRKIGEQFPQMIAAALRRIMANNLL